MNELRMRISALWVVVMFNMVFADILTFIKPGALLALWAGQAGVTVTPSLLLVFAVLLEVPIAMVYLSRVLSPGANRWVNTAAVAVTALFVVGGGSMDPHYVFFAAVEVACMLFVVKAVWSSKTPEAAAS